MKRITRSFIEDLLNRPLSDEDMDFINYVLKIDNYYHANKEDTRWIPKDGQRYYYISENGSILDNEYYESNEIDEMRISTNNCFSSKFNASYYLDLRNTHYELIDLAKNLGKPTHDDFLDSDIEKYSIYCFFERGQKPELRLASASKTKQQGTVYCLNDKFLDIAIDTIGEEKLIKYIINW